MSIRPLNLPADFNTLTQLTVDSFQYPENESWSIQTDEQENIVDMFNSARKTWFLLRLLQLVSPAMRHILRGYLWEEDGQPVGMIIMQRQNKTSTWQIGNVGVLPEFRRRGIARKLVVASLDFIREHDGKMALLDVIAGNVPAYTLYEKMGFVHYSSRHEFGYQEDEHLPEIVLSDAYTLSKLDQFEWRPRFELGMQITPADVQQFEPVTEAHYNPGQALMLLSLLIMKISGLKMERIAVRQKANNKIVAYGLYQVRKRAGGVNGINLRVHPEHREVGLHLFPFLINTALRLGPGRRIEFSLPAWQENVLDVVNETACKKRYEYHSMGIAL